MAVIRAELAQLNRGILIPNKCEYNLLSYQKTQSWVKAKAFTHLFFLNDIVRHLRSILFHDLFFFARF